MSASNSERIGCGTVVLIILGIIVALGALGMDGGALRQESAIMEGGEIR